MGEIVLIVIVVYLIFGPKKIPELARMLGKGINELRRATDDIKREFNREVANVKKDINVEDPFATKEKSTTTNKNTEYSKPEQDKRDNAPPDSGTPETELK